MKFWEHVSVKAFCNTICQVLKRLKKFKVCLKRKHRNLNLQFFFLIVVKFFEAMAVFSQKLKK